MREVLAFLLIVFLVVFLYKADGEYLATSTDEDTGCQYLMTWYFTPVMPRLDRDGKPVCDWEHPLNNKE
jgi:hypothetical protein